MFEESRSDEYPEPDLEKGTDPDISAQSEKSLPNSIAAQKELTELSNDAAMTETCHASSREMVVDDKDSFPDNWWEQILVRAGT